jgi:hypothetical protein
MPKPILSSSLGPFSFPVSGTWGGHFNSNLFYRQNTQPHINPLSNLIDVLFASILLLSHLLNQLPHLQDVEHFEVAFGLTPLQRGDVFPERNEHKGAHDRAEMSVIFL